MNTRPVVSLCSQRTQLLGRIKRKLGASLLGWAPHWAAAPLRARLKQQVRRQEVSTTSSCIVGSYG